MNSPYSRNEFQRVAGRLEFCFNNVWFVICSGDPWQNHRFQNERVVCQMLGYTTLGTEISCGKSSMELFYIL